ncbi:putative pectinesterase/pectinesterase inhibitor 39, partial [Cucurbita argyrosperma subsp. sororia]
MSCFFILFFVTFFCTTSSCISYNATVSLDGKGDYTTIGAAIAAAPNNSDSRFIIHVKPGMYFEYIKIESSKTFITLKGDDASTTTIVGNRSQATGFGTADSATFVVGANHFLAVSITFSNSAGAGPKHGQAVALLNSNNENYTVFYKCVFLGYQDTLFINGKMLFFKDCEIYGTVDFIFGNALVVFQDCRIYARLLNNTVTVTAQSKEYKRQLSGFSFQNCSVMASPELGPVNETIVFLGRPWRDYSTVIFMESFLDSVVNPAGWSEWSNSSSLKLLFYAEYGNRGPGANLSGRVKWPGFHAIENRKEATRFSVRQFINGTTWLPETGVPYRPDL